MTSNAAEPNATLEVPPVRLGGRMRKVFVAGVLIAVALGVAFWVHYQRNLRERAAAHALGELGAIVVMDAAGSHVGSVNLSTVQTPESLARAVGLLPALRYATSLDASRTSIGDEQMAAVGRMSRLTSLALNETGVTDAGLGQLGELRDLQALYLVKTGVSDDGVAKLAKLSDLHILDLSATKATDNLGPLAGLPQLEWLLLRETTLKDGALAKLAGCAALSRLSLEGSVYSADSLADLKKKLPRLSVDLAPVESPP